MKNQAPDECPLDPLNLRRYSNLSRSMGSTSLVREHSPNSFSSRPPQKAKNDVTTTEQTWLTNIVYAPLM